MSRSLERWAQWGGLAQFAVLVVLTGSILGQSLPPATTPTVALTLTEAKQAVTADPLDSESLRRMGWALELQGRNDDADMVLSFAGHRSWRDGATAAWLLRQRLVQGRLAEAVDQADALLRVDSDSELRPKLFPLLMAIDASDAGRAPIVDHLNGRPWWREAFLQTLAAHGDLGAAGETLVALRHGPASPQEDEISPYFERLVSAGDYALAQARWTQVAGPRCCDGPYLRDRNFASLRGHNPMTWSAPAGAGVSVQSGPDGLRIDYDGVSTPQITRQLLILAPGSWRLNGRQKWQGEDHRQSLTWVVRCAEDGRELVHSAQSATGEVWTALSLDLSVPAQACAAQWLQLEPVPGERVSPVTNWFRDFSVRNSVDHPNAPHGP